MAEKLAEASFEGLTYAVDNLTGPTLGTLQDVTCYQREKARYVLIIIYTNKPGNPVES